MGPELRLNGDSGLDKLCELVFVWKLNGQQKLKCLSEARQIFWTYSTQCINWSISFTHYTTSFPKLRYQVVNAWGLPHVIRQQAHQNAHSNYYGWVLVLPELSYDLLPPLGPL